MSDRAAMDAIWRGVMSEDPTTVDAAVEQAFGMLPDPHRPMLLPFRKNAQGKIEFVAPEIAYQAARAIVTPGVGMQGGQVSPEDALNFAGNITGGSVGASALVKDVGLEGAGTVYGAGVVGKAPIVGKPVDVRTAMQGSAQELAPGIVKRTNQAGGSSTNLVTGAPPDEGLMMGIYRNDDPRSVQVEGRLRRQDVVDYAGKNAPQLNSQDRFLGTWHNPDDAKTYFDVSQLFSTDELRKATKFGEKTGQLAGYDVGADKTFPVGNWEKFVNGPEFAQRLTDMEGVGRTYLEQFPATEWWDTHGSTFERVYGKDKLPQVAGYTAATAPNAAPRENLQTMSEYMRRDIKGEPILQPDYRTPEGLMTRQPGKQLGMEKSRANNILKAQAGDLNAMRANKVREEALALSGDPNAVVLDRHQIRLAEKPSEGVYTGSSEGVWSNEEKQYPVLKNAIVKAAQAAGRSPRDYSADVWTGIRETIKTKSDLYGQKFKGSAITGDSKSYADHFDELIDDKAKHLGISRGEMEQRLRAGDATLLSLLLGTPLVAALLAESPQQQAPPDAT